MWISIAYRNLSKLCIKVNKQNKIREIEFQSTHSQTPSLNSGTLYVPALPSHSFYAYTEYQLFTKICCFLFTQCVFFYH